MTDDIDLDELRDKHTDPPDEYGEERGLQFYSGLGAMGYWWWGKPEFMIALLFAWAPTPIVAGLMWLFAKDPKGAIVRLLKARGWRDKTAYGGRV